ncbi:alpha/beta hydrolase [Mycolicibacterium sp.]|uniref:alpha/beta hydrolase n=1 Tax=Mycolicibacterium sp. TaxID=2320850 RepID=UPI0037CB7987
MTLFALLHGGMHLGSSWDAVREELHGHGHLTVAPDLPVDDDAAGSREWAQVVVSAVDAAVGTSTDVIVVGHSISGLILPIVASTRSVRRMVFVGGLLPVPNTPFADHLADNPDAITFPDPQPGGTGPFGLSWETVCEGFYHDCPVDIAQRAFQNMRHQSFTVFLEPCPVEVWPDTPSTYVLLSDDRAVGATWARRNAHRVSADLIEFDSGHSPFFARPVELARMLLSLAGE